MVLPILSFHAATNRCANSRTVSIRILNTCLHVHTYQHACITIGDRQSLKRYIYLTRPPLSLALSTIYLCTLSDLNPRLRLRAGLNFGRIIYTSLIGAIATFI